MKTSHKVLFLAFTLLCSAAVMHQALAQDGLAQVNPTRVATCNVVQLFSEYNKAQTINDQLEKQKNQIEQAQQDQLSAIQRSERALKANYRPGTETYEKQWEEIQVMKMNAQRDYNISMGRAVRKYQSATLEVYRDILKAVETIAQKRGYDLVLYLDPGSIQPGTPQEMLSQIQQKKILYSPSRIDITTAVLKELDDAYQRSGTGR